MAFRKSLAVEFPPPANPRPQSRVVVDFAVDAVKQSEETITSFVEEAVSNLPEDTSEEIRATREVALALGRLFNPLQDGNTAANSTAAVTALVDHTEMSQAEAESAVTEWIATLERLQADLTAVKETAAVKAREAANTTACALATVSLWSIFGFLLAALGAAGGWSPWREVRNEVRGRDNRHCPHSATTHPNGRYARGRSQRLETNGPPVSSSTAIPPNPRWIFDGHPVRAA